jgi:CRISPR system Cascade subunit CasC
MSTFIDIHVLQTVPSSNMNRDDTGRPKTGFFGGFTRARVSSQAWKRATRKDFKTYLPELDQAVRTRRIIEDLASRLTTLDPAITQEEAIALAKGVMEAAGIKFKAARAKKPAKGEEAAPVDPFDLSEYLLFVSNQQLDRLADLALAGRDGAVDKSAAKAALQANNGIEVALFGRMVADDAAINVDAAVQVAHALSTHAVEPEFDYYTAVDDKNAESDPSAGMIGVIEFNSSTLYRYATIDLDQLQKNLGDVAVTGRAVEAFVKSFVLSMPSGKQNTFANGTVPEAVIVQARARRPLNLMGAFEKPIVADGKNAISTLSAQALARRMRSVDGAYGFEPEVSYVLAGNTAVGEALANVGEHVELASLVSKVREHAISTLGGPA